MIILSLVVIHVCMYILSGLPHQKAAKPQASYLLAYTIKRQQNHRQGCSTTPLLGRNTGTYIIEYKKTYFCIYKAACIPYWAGSYCISDKSMKYFSKSKGQAKYKYKTSLMSSGILMHHDITGYWTVCLIGNTTQLVLLVYNNYHI